MLSGAIQRKGRAIKRKQARVHMSEEECCSAVCCAKSFREIGIPNNSYLPKRVLRRAANSPIQPLRCAILVVSVETSPIAYRHELECQRKLTRNIARQLRASSCKVSTMYVVSIDFDVARLDDLGPLGDFITNETRKFFRRGRCGFHAIGAQPRLHVGLLRDARD